MEYSSLHLLYDDPVRALIAALTGVSSNLNAWERAIVEEARITIADNPVGSEVAANAVSFVLGRMLASNGKSFLLEGATFTPWEARIDRGIGMMMRPPSRLFIDNGLDPVLARAMPIRLEMSGGMMGGAWVPARLIPELQRMLDDRLERLARRMTDAEMNVVPLLSGMVLAADAAAEAGAGLYEALDTVAPGFAPATINLFVPTKASVPKALRARVEAAAKPVKQPNRLARWLKRTP